jgi:hypothetical protein
MIVKNKKVGKVWLKLLQAKPNIHFMLERAGKKIDCTLYDVAISPRPLSLLEQNGAGEYQLEPVNIVVQDPKEVRLYGNHDRRKH